MGPEGEENERRGAKANPPKDDRWFLAFDPDWKTRTSPWVIATRCDGGFMDEACFPVHPQRWIPLPDPQPEPTGWRWPTGHIEVSRAYVEGMIPSQVWAVSYIMPDGTFDKRRKPMLCGSSSAANERAEKEAAWSGLPVVHVPPRQSVIEAGGFL